MEPDYYQLATTVGIILVTFLSILLIKGIMRKYFDDACRILKVDSTNYRFFQHSISFLLYFLAIIIIIYSVPELRALSVTLFAGAGVLAAVIGLASQQAVSNIIGGIFIVIFKPFRVNDIVKVEPSYLGFIEDITMRHTIIRSMDNHRIIIPNNKISSETILNYTIIDPRICQFVHIGISFESDIDKARKIIQEEVLSHRLYIANKDGKLPKVRLVKIEDSQILLRVWVWAPDLEEAFEMEWTLLESIKKRFEREGIELPYPHTTFNFKDSED
ncbi:MAG: small conductance mechanosensitive channel [Limisphaerales bacterium]|jgi:small conductance mechanosensitive channel